MSAKMLRAEVPKVFVEAEADDEVTLGGEAGLAPTEGPWAVDGGV